MGHVLIIEFNTCSRFIVSSFEPGRTISSTILDSQLVICYIVIRLLVGKYNTWII